MQAVSDPDGREIVECLLCDWERRYAEDDSPVNVRSDIGALRRLLKLEPVAH